MLTRCEYDAGTLAKIYRLVTRCVKFGVLQKKPCEVCGEVRVHAHHDDYANPLDVRWVCATHHRKLHRPNAPRREYSDRRTSWRDLRGLEATF